MQILTVNQSFNVFSTKVMQPTADAILYDDNGWQLVWDATEKWFKWVPADIQNYDIGYYNIFSSMTGLNGSLPPVNKRSVTKATPVWINGDPTVIPTSTLSATSTTTISGIISCLQADLKADCDLIFNIHADINAPLGTAASATADSFITSFVEIAQWT